MGMKDARGLKILMRYLQSGKKPRMGVLPNMSTYIVYISSLILYLNDNEIFLCVQYFRSYKCTVCVG